MVGPFNAGSVRIGFEADVKGLQAGLKQAEVGMVRLGNTVAKTAATTEKAASRVEASVSNSGKALGTFANRIGNAGIRLVGLQLILQQFGSRAGTGKFGKEVRAASDSLTVFVTAVSIAPGPIGIAIGVIGGLATALVSLSGETAESKAAIDAWRMSLENTVDIIQLLVEGQLRGRVGQENLTTALAVARRELQANLTLIISREKREAELQKLLKAGTIAQRDFTIQMISLGVSVAKARTETFKLTAEFTRLFAEVEDQQVVKTLNTSVDSLGQSLNLLEVSTKAGLIEPMQKAAGELKAVEDTLRAMFVAMNNLSRKGLEEFGEGIENNIKQLKEQRAALQGVIQSIKANQALDEAIAGGAALEPILAQRRQRDARLAAEATRDAFADRFSVPFSEAIGQSVFDGIMQGAEAMEIVANIGEGLFANFLSQSITDFQNGMVKAFDAIAGAGGAVLGQALSAAVGIAGFFLSKQGRGDSSSAFAGVQSAIDSSQAVRGVVAGPTSVAIAAVGEDLRRAMEPTRELMGQAVVELRKIVANTSSGPGGGGGGAAFAGSVPTT